MKLRISLELYLKRMLVGGVERVYELERFRNEGIDATLASSRCSRPTRPTATTTR